MSEPVLSPAERAKLAKQKEDERREANRYLFPKGNGPDKDGKGHHGKVKTVQDTTTQKKGTPVFEVHAGTDEVLKDGKKVDIKLNFWKSDKALDFLYRFLEMAGADLSGMPARQLDEAGHDSMVNKCMNHLEDINARFRFSCAHKERKGIPGHPNVNYQKDGIDVNYYVREFNLVDGKLPLEGLLGAVQSKAPEVNETLVPPEAQAPSKEAPVPTDSAFADDDD